jgi:hypothetical protein
MKPTIPGSGWKISRSASEVPRLNLFGNGNWKWMSAETSLAQLSTQRHKDGLWGYFTGKVCNFAILRKAWTSVDSKPRYNSLIGNISSVSIFLDNVDLLVDSPEHQQDRYENILRDRRQLALARWLCNHFKNDKLCMLLLGSLTGPGRITPEERNPLDLKYFVGLIILQREINGLQYWQRLGFCAWEVEHLVYDGQDAPEKASLTGQDTEWQILSGLFG